MYIIVDDGSRLIYRLSNPYRKAYIDLYMPYGKDW